MTQALDSGLGTLVLQGDCWCRAATQAVGSTGCARMWDGWCRAVTRALSSDRGTGQQAGGCGVGRATAQALRWGVWWGLGRRRIGQ